MTNTLQVYGQYDVVDVDGLFPGSTVSRVSTFVSIIPDHGKINASDFSVYDAVKMDCCLIFRRS